MMGHIRDNLIFFGNIGQRAHRVTRFRVYKNPDGRCTRYFLAVFIFCNIRSVAVAAVKSRCICYNFKHVALLGITHNLNVH